MVPMRRLPMNRPNRRKVLECGGWRGTGLTPLWNLWRLFKPKRCVPSPLTHRTPRRWGAMRFMVPMHAQKPKEALVEPARRFGMDKDEIFSLSVPNLWGPSSGILAGGSRGNEPIISALGAMTGSAEFQLRAMTPDHAKLELRAPGVGVHGPMRRLPMNRPNRRKVLECGGWRGTGLTPLWNLWRLFKPKRCVPSPSPTALQDAGARCGS